MSNIHIEMKRYEIEQDEKWIDFIDSMDFIDLKEGYKFRVIPAFTGAIFRFRILAPSGNDYSIYFDAYDRLGIYGRPYYELYPYYDDIYRGDKIDDIINKIYEQETK